MCEPVGVHAVGGLHFEHRQQVAPFGVHAADGGRASREDIHLFVVLHQLFRVHQVVRREVGGLDAGVERVGDLYAAFLGHFGRDDDHAVGRARTVHGRCGGVFQDGVGFDALDVEVVDLLHRHLIAVEHEDRLVGVVLERMLRGEALVEGGGADARTSADVHLRQGVGVRTHVEVLGDAERRFEDLDGAQGVALGRHGFELFAGDRGR